VPAGTRKVQELARSERQLGVTADRSSMSAMQSDVHVMLHVNSHDGFTIAVAENKQLARIAKSTVLSGKRLRIMVPILDQLFPLANGGHPELFERYGLSLKEWEKDARIA